LCELGKSTRINCLEYSKGESAADMNPAPANPPQLTQENLRELQAARRSLRKVRRAVFSANLEGYTIAVCGGVSFLCGIGSFTDMLVGAVLTVIGIIEIISASRLRRLDLSATKWLACNQLALAVLILLYALWNIHSEIANPVSGLSDLSPQDAQAMDQTLGSIGDLTHEVMLLLYVSLIVAALVEAGMALYYYSRGAHVRRFLAETPEWIVMMQKNGVSI
jgi:uncharacterized membrane protein HdeD (DUF308 family)